MPKEPIEKWGAKKGPESEASRPTEINAQSLEDRKRLEYWEKMAEILAETQTALRLEKTKVLDQKRIEWWKTEAGKALRH